MSKRFRNAKIKSVQQCTKSMTKKGKLKGKNKKETRMLRNICTHHKYTKNGRLKPTIWNNEEGVCFCTMCGASFSTEPSTKSEIKNIVSPLKERTQQLKFATVACGLGQKTVDYATTMSVFLDQFSKVYNKTMKVAVKQNDAKYRKNNKGRNRRSNGSSRYGGWGYRG